MTSRTFLISFALLLVISNSTNQPAFAQETSKQAAVKFDEFGDEQYSSIIARLDNYAIQLQNQLNVKGFVVTYRSRRDLPGLSISMAGFVKNYLVKARGIAAERVVTVDGGIALCLTYELWIVPVGTTPKPRSDAYGDQPPAPDSVYKYAEYYYSLPQDFSENGGDVFEHSLAILDGFAAALRRQPHTRGFIIAYSQYRVERIDSSEFSSGHMVRSKSYMRDYLDAPRTVRKILQTERNHLIKSYGVAPSKIITVNGGYRKLRQVELWIVPRGEHAPIATPNAFPKQRAKRRTMRRR
ncbi:MAG: hypothetical protein ACR2LC_00475 [Pyrinomonadaceae bacterium]